MSLNLKCIVTERIEIPECYWDEFVLTVENRKYEATVLQFENGYAYILKEDGSIDVVDVDNIKIKQ